MTPRIERWRDEIRYRIEGWVGDRTHEIVAVIDRVQRNLAIEGDIAEIGVHQGMLLLLLAAVRRTPERVVGLDLFDMQGLNVDASGQGAHDIAKGAIEQFYPEETDVVTLRSADSMAITTLNLQDYIPRPVRLFSVDGGHTREHVLNDLSLAQLAIVGGGVVMLDDFFGPHWPTVTDGYYAFMATQNRRLAPFLIFQNKLYLTTISDHKRILETFATYLAEHLGEGMHDGLWKYVTLSGFSVLARG